SGPALVGNIGAPGRINYTLVGDTVNAAQRLEQLGRRYAADAEVVIIASAAALQRAGLVDRGQFLGPQDLRGHRGRLEAYRLAGSAAAGRIGGTAPQGLFELPDRPAFELPPPLLAHAQFAADLLQRGSLLLKPAPTDDRALAGGQLAQSRIEPTRA